MLPRKNQINLLPESVQQQHRSRKNLKWMAAAQVAIFVCIALVIITVRAADRNAWDDANYKAQRVNAISQDARQDLTAQEQAQRLQVEADFLGNHAPLEFDAGWVAAILEADVGNTTSIAYDGRDILLSGHTYVIEEIETHRQRLLDTDSFLGVHLGRITMQEDMSFYYELRVILR